MKFLQSIFLLIAVAMIGALVACGSSTSTPPPPPPPPPTVAIAATSGTPQSAAPGSAFGSPLTATVTTGGTPSSGVSVTFTAPGSGASGTFANGKITETDTTNSSGVATSSAFTANSAIGAYTVTAAATGASTPANFSLTNSGPTLVDGTYVFSLAGEDSATTGPYYVEGAFVLSGGSITSGEQDFISLATIAEDAITGGSVTTTADGNLQIVLNTPDPKVGISGIETINGTAFSTTRALIIAFDNNATSSGRVDQQTSTAAPSAGYAFFVAGVDGAATPAPQAIGGVININGSGTISGAGSVFDINDGGSVLQAQSFAASTVSAPDSFGRIVFTLNPSATVSSFNLVGYVVDGSHIRLVETSDTLNGTMGGVALGQGANTGTFTSISGSYVTGLGGFDGNGVLQAAGVLTANSGNVSGAINYNDLTAAQAGPSTITGGTYTVDLTGRVTMTGVTDGVQTFNLQIYLTGNGMEAEGTAVTMDTTDVLAGLSWLQTGGGSFTAASFSGSYVMDATGAANATNEPEVDAVGPITADGVGTLTGNVDLNYLAVSQTALLPVSGAFSANANGAFTGTITGLDVTTSTNQDIFSYYLIDTTKLYAIETDTNQLTLGFFTREQ